MALTITKYASDDYEDVWNLHQQTVSENDGYVKNLAFHTDIHDIPNIYEVFFVMRAEKQLIGMVGLKRIDSTMLELKRLQVAASHQGQGIGRTLIEHCLEYARKRDVSRLRLGVSKSRKNASGLYLSMGFKITHVEWETLGPDNEKFHTMFMEKEL